MNITKTKRRGSPRHAIALAMVLALPVAACGSDEDSGDSSADVPSSTEGNSTEQTQTDASTSVDDACRGQDGEGRTIGFANLGEDVPFAVTIRENLEDLAERCNLKVVNADNQLSPEVAMDNARNFMTQGVDGVVEFQIAADISGALCEVLGDTPVIAIDIAHPECAVFMGADNFHAGEINGSGVGEVAKDQWSCDLDAVLSLENFGVGQVNIDRQNGSIAGLESVCPDNEFGDYQDWSPEHPGTIVTRLDASWTDVAFEQTRDWLTAHPDAEHIAIVCVNDDSCVGAQAAVEASGREDDVLIGVNGGGPSVQDLIRTIPYFVGASAFFPERYADLIVPNIIRMMNGEEPESNPLLITHEFINADNIDEIYPS